MRERERERERLYGFLRYKTKSNCHPKGRVIPVKYVTQFIEQGTRKKKGGGVGDGTSRDGHTHWVMDILPYSIQMFWVIPVSSWVESKRVGYGYFQSSSGRVWIIFILDS